MITAGNWWRASEIIMRHLTRQTDARYRSRDNTLETHPHGFPQSTAAARLLINPSSQPPSQVFAGRYVDYNPYDPISYAQNNTGRGAGGSSGR
jgi:hypothetical protein